jgi:putative addiction module killer protein
MAVRVVEYLRADGSSPYRIWFDRLDAQAAAKVATATLRLAMGSTSNVKRIGVIAECRVDWAPGYRVYLGVGTKNRQQADIERAKAMFAEYKARKSAARPRGTR